MDFLPNYLIPAFVPFETLPFVVLVPPDAWTFYPNNRPAEKPKFPLATGN